MSSVHDKIAQREEGHKKSGRRQLNSKSNKPEPKETCERLAAEQQQEQLREEAPKSEELREDIERD